MMFRLKSAPTSALAALSLALLALPAAAQAPELSAPAWTVDKAQSRLGFTADADGEKFGGRFNSWDAEIKFDPANLGASSASVTIALGSVETDNSNEGGALQSDAWFATATFPNATFKTTAIRTEGSGYVADGTLTIRDKSQPVSLPFDLAIEGDVAKMKGALTIDRKAFGLGVGTWQDGHIAPEVTVEVAVTAKKA
jgi:polyisoprenoid-binding protein YceI